MKNLTSIVQKASEIARGDSIRYPSAAIQALKEVGYPNPNQQVGVTMYLNIDIPSIKFSDCTTLLSLVTMCLGQRGGNATALAQAESRQLNMVF